MALAPRYLAALAVLVALLGALVPAAAAAKAAPSPPPKVKPDYGTFNAQLQNMMAGNGYGARKTPAPFRNTTAVSASVVNEQFLVKINADAMADMASSTGTLLQTLGGSEMMYMEKLGVFHMDFSAAQDGYMPYIQSIPWVEAVEPNYVYTIRAQQIQATSSIDRMDQRNLPLDGIYNYEWTGKGVNIYVLDTGVFAEHQEFSGRVIPFYSAFDTITNTSDCNGHGSHVAGTAAGISVGIAKRATIYPMRVFSCTGSSDAGTLMTAVQFLMTNFKAPAVANLSLGGPISTMLDQVVQTAIAAGITFVIAAGNSNIDACNFSPGRVPEAITVAAVDGTDTRAAFSNYGPCVDVFAPGVNVNSVALTSRTAYRLDTGTSMSTPLVAGIAAMILEKFPKYTPAQVQTAIKNAATAGIITDTMTTNPMMAYSAFLGTNPNNVAVNIQAATVDTVVLPTTIAVVIVGAVGAGAMIGIGFFIYRRMRNRKQAELQDKAGNQVEPAPAMKAMPSSGGSMSGRPLPSAPAAGPGAMNPYTAPAAGRPYESAINVSQPPSYSSYPPPRPAYNNAPPPRMQEPAYAAPRYNPDYSMARGGNNGFRSDFI